jgi:hypothetical protein
MRSPDTLILMQMADGVATCMYYTGLDPFTKNPVGVATAMHDRKLQRALMQFFTPENHFAVREALTKAGRADLIGDGCDALIPATPPKEALEAKRRQANAVIGDHYHTVANPAKGEKPGERGAEPRRRKGYRPGRTGARRQDRHPKHKGGTRVRGPSRRVKNITSGYTASHRELSDKETARIE